MKITAILVHGAFSDGSVWNRVTPLLLSNGFDVISVQIPLDSLAGDVAATNRAIDRAGGPVVLVGHSWGGVVITDAGASASVKSLVYVAAFSPDTGQGVVDIVKGTEATPGVKAFTADSDGYISLSRDAVEKYLAPDIDESDANLMFINQKPINRAVLASGVTTAAWRDKPSFYAVSKNDMMTPTQLQREMAERIGATIIEIDAGHCSHLSDPTAIAELIVRASM